MAFEPATAKSPPPAMGPNAEYLTRDCKAVVDTAKLEELGKDIAAMANSIGGVIWVGVDEDKTTNVVRGYNPLKTAADAEAVRVAYQQAAGTYCSPSPLVETVAIPDGATGFYVAVSVWPFPGQAVGVRDAKDWFKYRFPIRLGNQTSFLRAEQLPMLMTPEIRRVAILLRGIAPGDAVHVIPEGTPGWNNATFVEIRELDNVVVFIVGDSQDRRITIPLDHIQSAWRDPEKWRVMVKGKWETTHLGGTKPRPP